MIKKILNISHVLELTEEPPITWSSNQVITKIITSRPRKICCPNIIQSSNCYYPQKEKSCHRNRFFFCNFCHF